MKKIVCLSVCALVLAVTSCTNKEKSRLERVSEFRNSLTAEDSTTMIRLCDDAMEMLKANNVDQVIASLYEYNDSLKEVRPLSETMAKRYSRRFRMYPVLDYKREYYSFMLEGCNDVKYKVTFATAEQVGSDKPATTMFMFNPVKVNGEWKLCVKNATDEIDLQMQ